MSAACRLRGLETMATLLTAGMQQELFIAFRAQNRAIHNLGLESERFHRGANAFTDVGV